MVLDWNPFQIIEDQPLLAFLKRRELLVYLGQQCDLIVFALVDSLVLHSSVSNLRLESYLFTRESMEDVGRRLKPDGLFVMYNYYRQGWIVSRLAKTAGSVFGRPPVVLTWPYRGQVRANEKADAFTMLFEGPRAGAIDRAFRTRGAYFVRADEAPSPSSPNGFGLRSGPRLMSFSPAAVEIPANLREARDAWPFLYLRNPMIPTLSWAARSSSRQFRWPCYGCSRAEPGSGNSPRWTRACFFWAPGSCCSKRKR